MSPLLSPSGRRRHPRTGYTLAIRVRHTCYTCRAIRALSQVIVDSAGEA
jgi:hypothetical protein